MNEEILHTNYGWECPKCGSVWSPSMNFCSNCNPMSYTTVTTPFLEPDVKIGDVPCSNCGLFHSPIEPCSTGHINEMPLWSPAIEYVSGDRFTYHGREWVVGEDKIAFSAYDTTCTISLSEILLKHQQSEIHKWDSTTQYTPGDRFIHNDNEWVVNNCGKAELVNDRTQVIPLYKIKAEYDFLRNL